MEAKGDEFNGDLVLRVLVAKYREKPGKIYENELGDTLRLILRTDNEDYVRFSKEVGRRARNV